MLLQPLGFTMLVGPLPCQERSASSVALLTTRGISWSRPLPSNATVPASLNSRGLITWVFWSASIGSLSTSTLSTCRSTVVPNLSKILNSSSTNGIKWTAAWRTLRSKGVDDRLKAEYRVGYWITLEGRENDVPPFLNFISGWGTGSFFGSSNTRFSTWKPNSKRVPAAKSYNNTSWTATATFGPSDNTLNAKWRLS